MGDRHAQLGDGEGIAGFVQVRSEQFVHLAEETDDELGSGRQEPEAGVLASGE